MVGISAIASLAPAAAYLTVKNSPGPAVACSGAARNPAGGGLAGDLSATWLREHIPLTVLKFWARNIPGNLSC